MNRTIELEDVEVELEAGDYYGSNDERQWVHFRELSIVIEDAERLHPYGYGPEMVDALHHTLDQVLDDNVRQQYAVEHSAAVIDRLNERLRAADAFIAEQQIVIDQQAETLRKIGVAA